MIVFWNSFSSHEHTKGSDQVADRRSMYGASSACQSSLLKLKTMSMASQEKLSTTTSTTSTIDYLLDPAIR